MACLNRPPRRRHKQARRAKWGFELELEQLQRSSLPKVLPPCGGGGGRGVSRQCGSGRCGSAGSGGGAGSCGCAAHVGTRTTASSSSDTSGRDLVMPSISRFILEGSKLETKVKIMHRINHNGRSYVDGGDYSVNPEPMPFMSNNFMKDQRLLPFEYSRSSTLMKKIPISKRHQDMFGADDYNFLAQKGVMLHTARDQYEILKSLEGLNQRDRLLAEMAYVEHLREIKRRREILTHRAQLDLYLGGKKMECEERFDINREIQRLKAMAMPSRARDLFHGRGIFLPPTHLSLVPRPPRVPLDDSDSDEEVRVTGPAAVHPVPDPALTLDPLSSTTMESRISVTLGDMPRTRSYIKGKRFNQLPSLHRSQQPKTGLPREDTSLSKSQSSIPHSNRSAAWVEEQNHLLHNRLPRNGDQQLPQLSITAKTEKRRSPDAPPPTTEGKPRTKKMAITLNPLQVGANMDVSEEQESDLRQTFERLDTDRDGDLQYHQLRTQLPKDFSQQQENFVKQVYDITRSNAAFFGVDEFLMMTQLTDRVASLTGPAQTAYGQIEYDSMGASIVKYLDLFQSADTGQKGRINLESLRELIGKSQNKAPLEESSSVWNTIMDSLCLDYTSQVTRTEYLANIPLFMSLAPPPPQTPAQNTGDQQQPSPDQ